MKKIVIIIVLMAFAMNAKAYHWSVDPHQYPNTMTVTAVVSLDGAEQFVSTLEVGAFSGEECRGRDTAIYVPQIERYMLFLTLYGSDESDTLVFRLYDHGLGEELSVRCLNMVPYTENGILGTLIEPYVIEFLSQHAITVTANPENGGTVEGAGTYDYGATATLTATAAENYNFVNWTLDGEEVSTEESYSFTVTEAGNYVANFELSAITQTTSLSAGWNWWSGYVELGGNDGLVMLQEALGTNGVMIKSQNDGFNSYLEGFGWYGALSAINNESMYQVRASAGCTIELTGQAIHPADHPITLGLGWNWIGFPSTESMSVTEAFSGITPQNGDMLKSQNNGFASYLEGFGWYGQLTTLTPGMGLMYKSNNSQTVTFTFPTVTEGGGR